MEHNILLVDDDPGLIRVMARMLAGLGQFRFATDGLSAIKQAQVWVPDLIVLDAEMPVMSGYQVCTAMKADPLLRDVPIIFVTSHIDHEFEVQALELGAADFLAKPVNEPLVVARVKAQLRLKRLTDGLRLAACKDVATQLPNRATFDEQLTKEWARAQSTDSAISLLMLEMDFMDLYAARHGQPQMDKAMLSVAGALQAVCNRPADLVARVDRNTFALLLPNTASGTARDIAQQAIDAVQGLAIEHGHSPLAPHLTATVGLSAFDGEDGGVERSAVDSNDLSRCALAALGTLGDAGSGGAPARESGSLDGRLAIGEKALLPLEDPELAEVL